MGGFREERKVLTVLFADLVDFTSRAESMDVEDVRGLLEPYYALLKEELVVRGGVVEKFIGDAVVALFGAPAAHEDDPERAVRAALAIQEAVAAANRRRPELELHLRVGVNTGEALISLDARPAAGETIASGDVINTAARLQAAAPMDAVIVGELTREATRDAIDYEQLPSVTVKGKTEPIRCWRAVRTRARIGERGLQHGAIRLIDRRRELGAVVRAFDRTCGDEVVRAVTLVGMPGIGKTRLVREFAGHVDRRPELIRWRQGQSLPYGHGATLSALAEIVKAEAGLLESHESAVAGERLAHAVGLVARDSSESAWLEQHLGVLVGQDGAAMALFGDRRAEAFAAWRRFLERLAQHRPTVLVFEDLHWADDAAIDFVDDLIVSTPDVPLFVLCTARPELLTRRPGWGAGTDRSQVVSLTSLSDAETTDLLKAMLGWPPLPSEMRTALLSGAAGNPLFAQEFVRLLIDRGMLVEAESGWKLERIDELPVPQTVLGIIAARLDALPADDKGVIQDAALVGRAFWGGAVAHAAGRSVWAVDEALRRLERRELIRRRVDSTVADESEYVFQHTLTRDVAYRSILRPLRAERHVRVAEWLTTLAGDRRDRAAPIAHHYVTALENARAVGRETPALREAAARALEEAAAQAAALNSHRAAAAMYRRALALCEPTDGRRPALLFACGKSLALADEPAGATLDEAARELLAAGDLLGAAEAESTAGWLLSISGKPDLARDRDERALALASGAAPSRAVAEIFIRAGAHLIFLERRRGEAVELLRRGAEMAADLGLHEMEAEALNFVGLTRLNAGDAGGVEDSRRAVRQAADLNSPVLVTCIGNLADICWDLGRLDEAATLHAEGLETAERLGIPVQVRRFRAAQATGWYYAGDWDAALERLDEYLRTIRAGSPHRGEADALVIRGRIRLAREDVDGAWEDAAASLEFARRTGEPFTLRPALAFHARAALERAPELAAASVDELLRSISGGQTLWGTWALPDALPALEAVGRLPELRRLIAAATPESRWHAAAAAACEGDYARAADVYAAIGSGPEAALCRLRAADAALAAGDREHAHEQLGPAVAFARQAGARAYLRVADALVS